jgi:hypothetical protein
MFTTKVLRRSSALRFLTASRRPILSNSKLISAAVIDSAKHKQRTLATATMASGTGSVIAPAMEHSTKEDYGMNRTSGYKQPVWISTEPYSNFPKFPKLAGDIKADVIVVGGGIAGISVAYECVKKGVSVALIEARNTLSGESGRTSGHLASSLDDRYYNLIKSKFSYPLTLNSH